MEKEKLNKLLAKDIAFEGYDYSDKYINRELSWLEFNRRVLHQAMRDIPLLERLNFLSITSSNLDEFIMVRFSSVYNKLKAFIPLPEIAGMYPDKEYRYVLKGIKYFKYLQQQCFEKLIKKLEKEKIVICKYKDLNKSEKEYVNKVFYQNIYPLLTPINFDTTKEFPTIKSRQMNIVVELEDSINANLRVVSVIPIDNNIDRVIKIKTSDEEEKYILLEEVVYHYLNRIFVNKKIVDYGAMRLLRTADIELNHNQDNYITDRMRKLLGERESSEPIFMEVDSSLSKSLIKLLSKIFNLEKKHVYQWDSPIDYTFLSNIKNSKLQYEKFQPQYPSEFIGEHDIFTAMDHDDIILHHPYESFDPVLKLLEHAANDKNVVAIKQTLYRVSSIDSPIVESLCNAAMKGKQVTVILEIKARFDEGRNISLIEKMKMSGIKLVYGSEELKTHCKFIVVARKHKDGLKLYSHIGTGNYNDKTAKLYTDISYMTSNYKIGEDLISVFNMLSGFSEPDSKINKVYFSPYNLRKKLYNCIDNEIKNVKDGKKGLIIMKMNSICDKEFIDKLYHASKAGVKIIIYCRGICSMKPINKNITIRSLVGRFLEHSRIYYFHNNKKGDIFISSADLLTRNLDKRFELLIGIKSPDAKTKLLRILFLYSNDIFNSYEMNKKGEYMKVESGKGDKDINIHSLFMKDAIEKYKLKNMPKWAFKK